MAKQKNNQSLVFKINSSRLRRSKWSLDLKFEEARDNKEIISLSSSQVLRWIDELNKIHNKDQEINSLKEEKNKIIQGSISKDSKKEIIKINNKINKLKFVKDYVCIIFDKKSDFDRCNSKKGFFINGKKYKRLLGTTGGVKNETIVYISEDKYDEIKKRLNNGRNIDKPIVPAKLEAYFGLACSNSIPVDVPKGVLVINDCITNFKEDVIKIDDSEGERPVLSYEKDYDVELVDSDGFGLISPKLSEKWAKTIGEDYIPSGYCIRNSFCKGMAYTFDFYAFGELIAKNYIVKDAWGVEKDIRDVEIILTTSMLKLWDSYNSIEHYLECCEKNKYTFAITKCCPKELEHERTMNYQFLQSFEMDNNDLKELIQPTIDNIKNTLTMDYAKTILYLRGKKLNDKNVIKNCESYIKALMVEKELLSEPFIQQKIINMRKKRINDAKVGVIDAKANYVIISGDPYSLCQYIFGLEVTGLLKKDEGYCKYWTDRGVDEILGMRAPMTCHNNIRKIKMKRDKNIDFWYQYMNTCLILNSWDTITHAENGADKDLGISPFM